MRVLRVDVATGAWTEPFDAQAVLGGLVTDLAGIVFEPTHRNLVLLSQESRLLIQTTPGGVLLGRTMRIEGAQPEGVALSPDGRAMYVISEPNQVHEYRR